MRFAEKWFWVPLLAACLLFSAEGFSVSAVSLAQPTHEEKDTVKKTLRTPLSGTVYVNPCFLPGVKIRECLQTPAEGLPAERALKRNLTPFENADTRGNLLFTISGRRIEWVIQSLSGDQAWILRWDLPEKK